MLGRGTQPCGYCRKGGAGYIFLLIKYINHSMSEMKIIHSSIKSSTCASYGLGAALSAHKLVHLGREAATGQTEIFVSSALSPESHTTPPLLWSASCWSLAVVLPFSDHFHTRIIRISRNYSHIQKSWERKAKQNLATSQSF